MAQDPRDTAPRPADVLVIFGITGDLAKIPPFLFGGVAKGLADAELIRTGRVVVEKRQDGVEAIWRTMQPLLDAPSPVQTYAPGSWGPAAADALVAGSGGWRGPWVAS